MSSKKSQQVKTTKLSRVAWKKGRVLAFHTLNDVYVLGQLVGPSSVAFFDAFALNCKFTADNWESAELLHVIGITDQFMRRTEIRKTELEPKAGVTRPTTFIGQALNPDVRRVVLWEGTPDERRLKVEYGGALMWHSGKADYWPSKHDYLKKRIRINDLKTINGHELQGLAVHEYTNHRLYLCHVLQRNADPIKELRFRYPLPLQYRDVIRGLYPDDHF